MTYNLVQRLDHLQDLAAIEDSVIYNILFRTAGIAIQWYEGKRVNRIPEVPYPKLEADDLGRAKNLNEWREEIKAKRLSDQIRLREGLVVYEYHDNLIEMIESEIKRLESKLNKVVSIEAGKRGSKGRF